MDAAINANSLAMRRPKVCAPIARASVNAPAEIAIGLIYGFVSVALFCQLVPALPAGSGLA